MGDIMELFPRNIFSFPRASKKDEEYRRKVFEIKKEILSRFSVNQLEELRLRHLKVAMGPIGIINPTKYDLVKYMASNLSLDEVVDEAERYGIEYKDLIKKLKKFKKESYGESLKDKKISKEIEELENGSPSSGNVSREITNTSRKNEDRVLSELMRFLENELKLATDHIAINKHDEVKKFLKLELIKKYGEENVVTEKKRKGGKRPDLVVFDKYGIEIKLGDHRAEIERLPTQIELYRASGLKEVIGVIIEPENEATPYIPDIVEVLKKRDMKYIIVKGKIKRTQRRVRTYKLIDEKPKRRKSSRSKRKK